MSKWAFSFKEGEVRSLTEAEIAEWRERHRQVVRGTVIAHIGSWASGLAACASFILATQQPWVGGLLFVALCFVFFRIHGLDYWSERRELLYRRIPRIGKVQRFDRGTPPANLRSVYAAPVEDDQNAPFWPYWEHDERFEKKLEEELGRPPQWIELLLDDEVVVTVEGKVPKQLIEATVLEAG